MKCPFSYAWFKFGLDHCIPALAACFNMFIFEYCSQTKKYCALVALFCVVCNIALVFHFTSNLIAVGSLCPMTLVEQACSQTIELGVTGDDQALAELTSINQWMHLPQAAWLANAMAVFFQRYFLTQKFRRLHNIHLWGQTHWLWYHLWAPSWVGRPKNHLFPSTFAFL